MKIAICDDDQQELQALFEVIRAYQETHPALQLEIESFLSVDALCKQPLSRYDLLILDILMPQMNGIEFVRAFRADGGQAEVIFVTSSPYFALDAFAVNATQYLLKPVCPDQLFIALDKITSTYVRQGSSSILVSTQDGIKNIYFHNIAYVECIRHFAHFHLSDGTTASTKTLRQSFVSFIAPLLEDNRFVHAHHSFVVNKEFVSKLNQRSFELFAGQSVPISRDRLSEVKRSYLSYIDQRSGA